MPLPIVSEETITSIREQSIRITGGRAYCMQMIMDLDQENPYLAAAIKDTVIYICDEFNIDTNTDMGFKLSVNMTNLAAYVYQAMKQQIVCDE